ncbi:hypothetical protein Tco_0368766 [Tanacetum coccineum]
MPDDDLRSVSGFDTADSDDTHKNVVSKSNHIFQDDNASDERLSLPDHMDHICEEVSSLHSKHGDMKSSIIQQVSAEIKTSLPALITNTLTKQLLSFLSDALKDTLPQLLKETIKSSVLKSITEELPHVEAQVQKNLQDQLPNLLLKPMYKEFNAFNQLESQRFFLLQKELSKSLHKSIRKSIRLKEKNNPAEENDAQHPDQTTREQISGANTADIVQGEQPSAQVVTNEEKALSLHEFTDQLFGTTSSKFSPTPPREPTSPRDPAKGKKVAIVKEQVNELVTYQEGGFIPKMRKLKSFITPEETLSQEEFNNQIKELKRISDLKAQKDKSEQELRKMFNQATLKAQAKKWTEHEEKKAKILEEYNHQISFRADPLPITKISYVVNTNKEETMKITRGDNPLNLIVHPNFRLKSLGFSEWLEVMDQAKKLRLPPPPSLATFGMTAEEKKRKRTSEWRTQRSVWCIPSFRRGFLVLLAGAKREWDLSVERLELISGPTFLEEPFYLDL